MLVLPQAAKLGIHFFKKKAGMLHLQELPFKRHITEDRGKKAQRLEGIEPIMTLLLQCVHSTAVIQPLPPIGVILRAKEKDIIGRYRDTKA